MNHSQRIAEVARHHRQLTQRLARVAIETYLELLAEDIAQGEWVELHGLGKIQVTIEAGSGQLIPKALGKPIPLKPRLRSKIRLNKNFKNQCYQRKPTAP